MTLRVHHGRAHIPQPSQSESESENRSFVFLKPKVSRQLKPVITGTKRTVGSSFLTRAEAPLCDLEGPLETKQNNMEKWFEKKNFLMKPILNHNLFLFSFFFFLLIISF